MDMAASNLIKLANFFGRPKVIHGDGRHKKPNAMPLRDNGAIHVRTQ